MTCARSTSCLKLIAPCGGRYGEESICRSQVWATMLRLHEWLSLRGNLDVGWVMPSSIASFEG